MWDVSWRAKEKGKNINFNKRRIKNEKFEWQHLTFWSSSDWALLKKFLNEEEARGAEVLPSFDYNLIFRSLILTPFKDVRVVILGQDPYPKKGLADGLSFSIRSNVRQIPKGSLSRIFAEYREDLGFPHPLTGDLSSWARNGVLLANSIWTVEVGKTRAHETIYGRELWQLLTQEIIKEVSNRKDKVVFILWGKEAQRWRKSIDETKHLVLVGAHPSPRNATYTGKDGLKFLGGKYFTKAAEFLNVDKRMWRLP